MYLYPVFFLFSVNVHPSFANPCEYPFDLWLRSLEQTMYSFLYHPETLCPSLIERPSVYCVRLIDPCADPCPCPSFDSSLIHNLICPLTILLGVTYTLCPSCCPPFPPFFPPFIIPSIYPSIYPSIDPSFPPSLHPSLHLSSMSPRLNIVYPNARLGER